jgi:hypothetical protein
MSNVSRIYVIQSGGFTGRVRSAEVEPSRLSADDTNALEQLVAAALPSFTTTRCWDPGAEVGADRRQYDLVIETHGGRYEMRVGEADVPEAVKLLIARVIELGRRLP